MTTQTTTPEATPRAASKADHARAIFATMYPTASRKDIISRFKAEAGLSDAGSATYYQNFVKKAKEAAPVTTPDEALETIATLTQDVKEIITELEQLGVIAEANPAA